MKKSCVQILSLTQFATLLPSRIDEILGFQKGTHLEQREKKLITIRIYIYISFKVEKFGELKKFDSIA